MKVFMICQSILFCDNVSCFCFFVNRVEGDNPTVSTRERDNWESNCFSEIIASNYSISDLIDTRVSVSRLCGEATKESVLKETHYLYLLHIHVLSAWIYSKYYHAKSIRDKFINTQQTALDINQKSNNDSTHIAPPPESIWKKMFAELQIKKIEVLILVLEIGHKTNIAQKKLLQGLLTEAPIPDLSNLVELENVSRVESFPSNVTSTEIYDLEMKRAVKYLSQWWITTIRESMCQKVNTKRIGYVSNTTQWSIPGTDKLATLLQSIVQSSHPPNFSTAQNIIKITEEFLLEMKSYCYGLPKPDPPMIQILPTVELNKTDSSADVTRPPKRRRIQPTSC
jgi:hypothetical protein